MGLRELKEIAHQQFVRGKFAQCAQTYHQILRLAPRDPNMRVRHAEACKRAGERLQAIASYRAAADLLLELGCESRARGALKAALELDPLDPLLQADVARLGPQAVRYEGEHGELPLLPPLESSLNPVPPSPAPAPRPVRVLRPEAFSQTPALPKIHRALPAAPSVPPIMPPVLLPAPRVASTASAAPAPAAPRATPPQPRSATARYPTPAPQPASAPLPPRSATASFRAPAIAPVTPPVLTPRSATANVQAPSPQSSTPPPRSVTAGHPAPGTAAPAPTPRVASPTSTRAQVPPPPPPEAIREHDLGASLARTAASLAPEPAPEPRRLEVRRLSPNAIAFRCSPTDSWALIRAHTPLEMHLVDDLERLPPMMRDLTPEIMVEAEGAASVVH